MKKKEKVRFVSQFCKVIQNLVTESASIDVDSKPEKFNAIDISTSELRDEWQNAYNPNVF